jgi:hypothetical protein
MVKGTRRRSPDGGAGKGDVRKCLEKLWISSYPEQGRYLTVGYPHLGSALLKASAQGPGTVNPLARLAELGLSTGRRSTNNHNHFF